MKTIMLLLVGTALTCFVYGCLLGPGDGAFECEVTVVDSFAPSFRDQPRATKRGRGNSEREARQAAKNAACKQLSLGSGCGGRRIESSRCGLAGTL